MALPYQVKHIVRADREGFVADVNAALAELAEQNVEPTSIHYQMAADTDGYRYSVLIYYRSKGSSGVWTSSD